MKRSIFYIVIIISLMGLTGCVKTPNVSFNAGMNKDIKSIAIIPPTKRDDLNIFYYNHPGESFGLIGASVAIAEFNLKTSTYNELIASSKFDPNSYFINRLVHYLKQEHYKTTILPLKKERQNGHLKKYPPADTDAYLDVEIIDIGYIAGGPASMYKPTVKVAARLVKRKNKTVVYDKYLAVGENFALAKEVDYLGYEHRYSYKDFDALKANASKSIEGLKKSLDNIAKHLGYSLRKR